MLREDFEILEKQQLSPFASLSTNSRGRTIAEEKDTYRTEYQRDFDRIIYSKAFRRLQYKTQVFIAPKGDHYRNRLTHTLEVMTISRSISRALRLNPDLTEAISLGHDLGHSPFGHAGEDALNKKSKEYDPDSHFFHPEQSLRVVDMLERRIKSDGTAVFGLNLTEGVREGILKHSKGLLDLSTFNAEDLPVTLEGQVARISDRIAYIHHDLDDAIRAGIVKEKDVPQSVIKILGETNSKRLSTIIQNVIEESFNKNIIQMSKDIESTMDELKDFLTEKVYIGSAPKKEEQKVIRLIYYLFDYFYKQPEKLNSYIKNHPISLNSKDPIGLLKEDKKERIRIITDYISSMTDRFAIELVEQIITPTSAI
ncbi:MAG: deoxyguanosinetriphosphate triphosphohydrolase [Caldiserica bacterium CG02_land_8_20_14_3_00_36_38]|nr:deoxyguanosinetriphosphate triphosphohydrolase [Caldisericota bacterium]OIP13434.1 MAG: deoxyguanosinetriphosphate triphosphohydrolase [Caldisericum sp. CG2_30_36_11]PIP50097.1 MAG: deoxyguanosinetriphosphate triphosphohydrolase [Caldiserica bacterium CG23_combo_of_CG06-09_8_20_14_all_35_60]PIV56882.1 MAG: deoxyguanosinetriphosphate triphosphohydrolase [Caldiserica bacterium CG02_land_8_20_14_3_00_36_38]PIW09976.1 MAG: deoxyguanosinetriphosphate triphosphohydrolase [Caldiserica bacterium CG1